MKKLNNLKFKVPLISFVISFVFVIIFVFIDNNLFRNQLQKVFTDISCIKIDEREKFFLDEMNNKADILLSIRKNRLFTDYLNNKQNAKENLESLFEEIIHADKKMMQIRFLNAQGKEEIRFDRKSFLDNNIEHNRDLQDKSSRYYFTENIKNKEEIWFSKLDLNIEEQMLELPFKGTFRVILPVVKNEKFQGMLILNYFAEPYLNIFLNATINDPILLDKDGYIIDHYEKGKNWSRYHQKTFKIEEKYLKELHRDFVCEGEFTLKKLQLPFQNDLYILLKLNKSNHDAHNQMYTTRAYMVISVFMLLILIICILLYFVFRKFEKDEMDIQILTKEKKKQELLLIQKTKMASLGEMIANIAHQWRQPLTIIALNTTSLERKLQKDKVDKEFIEAYIKRVNSTVLDMSQTIEDFSEFFKPTKVKVVFDIAKLIEKALMILDKTLLDNNIKVIYSTTHNYPYLGYKNELLHVILNIITNSKDALERNTHQNGIIKIDLCKNEDSYKITIQDNGKGIDPNIIDKIYDSYFTTKLQGDGIGIGLYMSKTIIEDSLNGRISLENKNDGALCTIILPKEA